MDPTTVHRALLEAVQSLISHHRDILRADVHERTLSPHLANYLNQHFHGFNVDCEYNLDIDDEGDRKRAYGHGLREGAPITPDVIVHRRRMNGPANNILVIEIKKHGNRAPDCTHDRAKLCCCTESDGRNHLGFQRGALVQLGVGKRIGQFRIEWFGEGRSLGETNSSG